ncbi:MAG: hypothetical protein HFJ06_01100 [Lachnospiraceae bacterium]|nr:hypothetical protein [Lachnospiraceae bacterium]
MGNTKIQLLIVKAKTSRIKKHIKTNILNYNKTKIKSIKQCMKDSKGETVSALKSQLDQEAKLVNGMGDIIMELLEYIDQACNDFDQLDKKYASKKIQG